MLERLQGSTELQDQLRVATMTDAQPGVYFFYQLGDGYGCHKIRTGGYRTDEDGNPANDMRGAVEAGLFYVFDHNT